MNDLILEYNAILDTGKAKPSDAVAKIMDAGALDTYFIMSGNGEMQLHILLKPEKAASIQSILQGVSLSPVMSVSHERTILSRKSETLETEYGTVRVKTSFSDAITKQKLEFEDIKKISLEQGKSIREIRKCIESEETKHVQ